jgi:hypothetical protein
MRRGTAGNRRRTSRFQPCVRSLPGLVFELDSGLHLPGPRFPSRLLLGRQRCRAPAPTSPSGRRRPHGGGSHERFNGLRSEFDRADAKLKTPFERLVTAHRVVPEVERHIQTDLHPRPSRVRSGSRRSRERGVRFPQKARSRHRGEGNSPISLPVYNIRLLREAVRRGVP